MSVYKLAADVECESRAIRVTTDVMGEQLAYERQRCYVDTLDKYS